MNKLNETIIGMECCKYAIGKKQCSECPYERVGNVNCFFSLASDALELLKEKQPVKPTNDKGNLCCGSCGNPLHTAIVNPMIRFCDHCGKPVDWKDSDGE